jgi:glycine oxidase
MNRKKQVDLVIIGGGIAGITLQEKATQRGKTSIIIDNPNHQGSSWSAGALLHPLVFKRLTLAWPGLSHCEFALGFYSITAPTHWHQISIFRRISTQAEIDQWNSKRNDPDFTPILGPIIEKLPDTRGHNQNVLNQISIQSEFGFGPVMVGGWLDIENYLIEKKSHLESLGLWINSKLTASSIDTKSRVITLPGSHITIQYRDLVLATGISDPAWHNLIPEPVKSRLMNQGFYGVKGDCIDLYLPELSLNSVVLSSVFILPLGNNLFRIGSTYQREYTNNEPELNQAYELCLALESFVKFDASVLLERIKHHRAGIRPATRDRRPYLGTLGNNLWAYNGLGTRGLLIAPHVADVFLNHLDTGAPIPDQWSLERI